VFKPQGEVENISRIKFIKNKIRRVLYIHTYIIQYEEVVVPLNVARITNVVFNMRC